MLVSHEKNTDLRDPLGQLSSVCGDSDKEVGGFDLRAGRLHLSTGGFLHGLLSQGKRER